MGQKEACKADIGDDEFNKEVRHSVSVDDVCIHYWLIETPRGALSKGRCKGCGDEREFRNSSDNYLFEGTW